MKIRNGFVSNSSSSSFVIRGFKFKIKDLAKYLGIDPNQEELYDKIYEKFPYSKKLNLESTRSYFVDSEKLDSCDVIVGFSIGELGDGDVVAIKEPDDNKIRNEVESKLGRKVTGKLRTYVQYISNDNY